MCIKYQLSRFLMAVALLFAVAVLVQFFELPYGNAFFSLFYPANARVFTSSVGNFSAGNSSERFSNSEALIHGNLTFLSGIHNYTDDYGISELSDGKEAISEPPTGLITDAKAPTVSVDPNTSSMDKDTGLPFRITERSELLKTDVARSFNRSSLKLKGGKNVRKRKKDRKGKVVSLREMNDVLNSSLRSYRSKRPLWPSKSDEELLRSKSLTESSASSVNNELGLHAPLFRNFSMFKRSYELMEQTLKVYIYKEGERPIFHTPLLQGIYASEGWFMKQLKASKTFTTKNPEKAHLFYLPFSSHMLRLTLYVPNSHNRTRLVKYLNDYLSLIKSRYSFWNRTGGADHFLVGCHDWAPSETRFIMANCIRSLCNSDIKQSFQFGRDVSLPTTYVRVANDPLKSLGGQPASKRRILAFFAGSMHGYLRPILLKLWENKDPDMKIFGRMRSDVKDQMSYASHMKRSKYCICAKGYEVNSPRVVEAIFYECVPVIISDNYVPPFFETLNWESFAVFIPEKEIPNLKNILVGIPEKRYLLLQKRVKLVQKHFLWHLKPVKYELSEDFSNSKLSKTIRRLKEKFFKNVTSSALLLDLSNNIWGEDKVLVDNGADLNKKKKKNPKINLPVKFAREHSAKNKLLEKVARVLPYTPEIWKSDFVPLDVLEKCSRTLEPT